MNHPHECKHGDIKFCKECSVPYCVNCGKEWAEKCNQDYYFWGNQTVYPDNALYTPHMSYPSTTMNTHG